MQRSSRFHRQGHFSTFDSPLLRRGAVEVLGLVVVAILLAGIGGGLWWFLRDDSAEKWDPTLLHEVARDEFVLTVTERGEIESSEDIEVRCEVKAKNSTGTAIIRLVEEGASVQPGDFLVELDSSALEAERTLQQIAVNSAHAMMIESQNAYETAVISLNEYVDGTFVQEQQTIENEIFVAKENLSRAKDYLTYSERLAAKGHITEQQLEADRFAVEKAAKELEVAETKLQVLEEFTKAKEVKTLESAIATAKAKWESDKKSYELEQTKLQEIEDQIAKCTITAPTAGTVVYAHERRRGEDLVIKEGLAVREQQILIRLPNPEKMQVELKINEALVKYVSSGMKANVKPTGFETALPGTVTHVNQFAEPTSWRNPNVREYIAHIQIDRTHPEVRSGMTATVTIECSSLPDVIKIPVQAVYAHGRDYFSFVRSGDRWEARPVVRGPTNDKFIVVESGLEEGEVVALDPRNIRDLVGLPDLSAEQSQNIVQHLQLPRKQRSVIEQQEELPQQESLAGGEMDDQIQAGGGGGQ